ncbi:hypothetical protein BH10BAC2_BH10BAC2_46760 [soil metagenome]
MLIYVIQCMRTTIHNKIFYFLAVIINRCCITAKAQDANTIWYTKPAINFNEALPIGNGRMGAMIYGGVQSEYISLNEQTLWFGGPNIKWNNTEAKNYLPLVRAAALAGEYKKTPNLSKLL